MKKLPTWHPTVDHSEILWWSSRSYSTTCKISGCKPKERKNQTFQNSSNTAIHFTLATLERPGNGTPPLAYGESINQSWQLGTSRDLSQDAWVHDLSRDQQKVDDCYEVHNVHNLIFMMFVCLFFAYLQMVCESFINRPVMCEHPDINPGHLWATNIVLL